MSPRYKKNSIKIDQYNHLHNIGVAYEGLVEDKDGEIFYVSCKASVVTSCENRNQIFCAKSTISHEIPVCVQDNIYVDKESMIRQSEYNARKSGIEYRVKQNLLNSLISYYQQQEHRKRYSNDEDKSRAGMYEPSWIKIDVPELERRAYYQDDFAKLKQKIEDKTVKRTDFSSNISFNLKQEIDIYFACFDPKDENYRVFWQQEVEEVGFWESLIPIWGSAKSSAYHFEMGDYWYATGYALLAISDVFLIKSIATGVAKGAWKFGSHSWSATRSWLGKRGYVKPGEQVHHWMIHQSTAKKYGIEAITNQPWNFKVFKTQSTHFRYGHGWNFGVDRVPSFVERAWIGTPIWPKAFIGSSGGRIILYQSEEE